MAVENRESFFQRLQPFFVPSVLLDVELAYTLAKFGHRAQVRKEVDETGEPVRYFEHVRRVALIVIDEARVIRPELVISALLHDSLEDMRNFPPAMIEHCFGAEVCSIVKTLTKVPKEGYLDRFYASSDWRPYLIKACDRLDNLRSLIDTSPEFQLKQVTETREKYYPLFDRLLTLAPRDVQPAAWMLRDEIRHLNEGLTMLAKTGSIAQR